MDEIAVTGPPTLPTPIARWDFSEAVAPFASGIAGAPALRQGPGSAAQRVLTPFGSGVRFNGATDYLRVAAAEVGPLNVGASTGSVTVAGWVFSSDTDNALIAGCWNGSTGNRSYALFNDLPTYGGDNRVCMHVSKTGGVTPGYPHSIDYAADPRMMTRESGNCMSARTTVRKPSSTWTEPPFRIRATRTRQERRTRRIRTATRTASTPVRPTSWWGPA